MDSNKVTTETKTKDTWRHIAWNGVRFSVPADWEIGRIGLRYLEFELETGPVMEVKWNRVKGRFSHRAHLRRLAGMQKRNLKKSFQPAKLPASWEQALERFDVSGFSWQSAAISAKGVLIYNPTSQVATLVQFYRRNATGIESAAGRLLASLRNEASGDVAAWEIYDIRATIPVEFELLRFQFEAGRYELVFSSKRQQLQMLRFSPASILLRRRDLAAMASGSFLAKVRQAPQWLQRDADAVEARLTPASFLHRAAARIRRQPAFRIFRLWHEIEKNRILGVQISARNPIDLRKFSAICDKYETI